jgi:hypothetical protein
MLQVSLSVFAVLGVFARNLSHKAGDIQGAVSRKDAKSRKARKAGL